VQGKRDQIVIDLNDLANCDDVDDVMINHTLTNTKSYITVFEKAIDAMMPEDYGSIREDSDPLDVLLYQRRQISNLRQEEDIPVQQDDQLTEDPRIVNNAIPADLMRKYTVFFKPPTGDNKRGLALKPLAVREIRAAQLGHFVTVRGIVTRISNVKPLIKVATYSCDQCANETFVEVTKSSFTPLSSCPSEDCRRNRIRGNLVLQTRACKFIRFQEVKIQEMVNFSRTNEG
jgi:DNA replication licensing factor MCM7